jgi:hypothetical protein
VRVSLVVVGASCPDNLACLGERAEPVLVKALVAELAVEALHVCGLRRLACLNQPQRHAIAVGPAVERVAGELWGLVGPNHLRQAAELPDPIKQARHILARVCPRPRPSLRRDPGRRLPLRRHGPSHPATRRRGDGRGRAHPPFR